MKFKKEFFKTIRDQYIYEIFLVAYTDFALSIAKYLWELN